MSRLRWRMASCCAPTSIVLRGKADSQTIMTYGVYGKWLHFRDGYPEQWDRLCEDHPDVPAGSTNKYQTWETVDPEKWVPDGYACVRVDSRGAGRSPGYFEPFSPRETRDFYNCIEWAGTQPWSNGKVGLNGISYYAMNAWQVAAMQPPHLAAICAWEGAADYYREMCYHGGILCTFAFNWYRVRAKPRQYGLREAGLPEPPQRRLGARGPENLTDEELGTNSCDFIRGYLLPSSFMTIIGNPSDAGLVGGGADRSFLSRGQLGRSEGLHPRGNFEGFLSAASKGEVAREAHGLEHLDPLLQRIMV